MPNFEQIPMNEEIEDTKTEKEDNENNKKKAAGLVERFVTLRLVFC